MSETKLNLNNLDKSDWKTYRFDEIAQSISERIDPTNTDLEVYVGLEHIDSESIHLKRHGKREDVKGQKLRFYPGDVIFGRRRAYQRKAAVATMDGFCSAHALVLRAKPDVIDPELFPFFLHSNQFMDRAVDISVGSLSPTINWGALKHQEFLLPSAVKQHDFIKLLWGVNKALQTSLKLLKSLEIYFEKNRNEIFSDEFEHPMSVVSDVDYQERPINKCMSIKLLNGIYKGKEFQCRGVRLINMKELFAYQIITDEEMQLLDLTHKEKARFLVEEGDLIFARRSLVVEGAGRCSIIGTHKSPMSFESSLIRVRLDHNNINSKYVFHFFKSKEGKRRIRRIVCFTTVAGIASSDLARVKIPTLGKEKEDCIAQYLDSFDDLLASCSKKIKDTRSLHKNLINQVF